MQAIGGKTAKMFHAKDDVLRLTVINLTACTTQPYPDYLKIACTPTISVIFIFLNVAKRIAPTLLKRRWQLQGSGLS